MEDMMDATARAGMNRLVITSVLLLLSTMCIIDVADGAAAQCLTSKYTLKQSCNASVLVSTGCFSSQLDSDNCSSFAGRFVDTLITDKVCAETMTQVCSQVGGTFKQGKACGFACDALTSTAQSTCKTDADCKGGSTSVCEAAKMATFSLSGLCCSYVYQIIMDYCDGFDCAKLKTYIESLRQKGRIGGGCGDSGCLPAPNSRFNITTRSGLERFETFMSSATDQSKSCAPQAYGPGAVCRTSSYTLNAECGLKISSQSCTPSVSDVGAPCAKAGASIDALVTRDSCANVVSPWCEAVHGILRCTATCNALCGSFTFLGKDTCRENNQCQDGSLSSSKTFPTLCCSSLKRLISLQCEGPNKNVLDEYITELRARGRDKGGCADTNCLSLPLCTEKLSGLNFCSSINGHSVSDPLVADDPLAWDKKMANAWDIMPAEVYKRTPECKTAYANWLCALNSRPCNAKAVAENFCAKTCEDYQMCNTTLEADFGAKKISALELAQKPGEICRSLGISGNTNCFNPTIAAPSVFSSAPQLVAPALLLSTAAALAASLIISVLSLGTCPIAIPWGT